MRHAPLVASLLIALAAAGCGATPQLPANLATPSTVGALTGLREDAVGVTYTLADGSKWTTANAPARVVYDFPGERTLFVAAAGAGREALIALVGNQQGAPTECKYSLRYGGRNWGTGVEAAGILWPKSESFASSVADPSIGGEYPSNTAFCLDDAGAIVTAYMAKPPTASEQPVPSESVK